MVMDSALGLPRRQSRIMNNVERRVRAASPVESNNPSFEISQYAEPHGHLDDNIYGNAVESSETYENVANHMYGNNETMANEEASMYADVPPALDGAIVDIPDDELLIDDDGEEERMGDLRSEARQLYSMEQTLRSHSQAEEDEVRDSAAEQLAEVKQKKVNTEMSPFFVS